MMINANFHIDRGDFKLDVTLELPSTGVTALFGPSGSGKTTCLRAMAGLERLPNSYFSIGDTIWQDEQQGIFVPTHQREIGYVFQEASLFPHLNVQQNLAFGQKRVPKSKQQIAQQDVVELLGISHLLKRSPSALSGGERQRVAIARALLTSPKLLLMDEPLSALDSKLKQEILPYLESLHQQLAIPIIYVSHSTDEVARLADHLCLLHHGSLVASGATAEILLTQHSSSLFTDGVSTLWQGKVARHAELLTEVRVQNQTLRLPLKNQAVGSQLRCRIDASDVSLSLSHPIDCSILNSFEGEVVKIEETERAGESLVTVQLEPTLFLQAQISNYSLKRLTIRQGKRLWCQIKSVAVL